MCAIYSNIFLSDQFEIIAQSLLYSLALSAYLPSPIASFQALSIRAAAFFVFSAAAAGARVVPADFRPTPRGCFIGRFPQSGDKGLAHYFRVIAENVHAVG